MAAWLSGALGRTWLAITLGGPDLFEKDLVTKRVVAQRSQDRVVGWRIIQVTTPHSSRKPHKTGNSPL